jgi:pyocin large subunit-like protein
MHDFKLYEVSVGGAVLECIEIGGGSGYQGILKFHKNSCVPKKKSKGGVLSVEEKLENRRLACVRILVEHVNAKVKVFKIVANRYRNRRKRFGLRMALICGIINFENKN